MRGKMRKGKNQLRKESQSEIVILDVHCDCGVYALVSSHFLALSPVRSAKEKNVGQKWTLEVAKEKKQIRRFGDREK